MFFGKVPKPRLNNRDVTWNGLNDEEQDLFRIAGVLIKEDFIKIE